MRNKLDNLTQEENNWQPHITVAAVIEHSNKFLLVSDQTNSGIKLNQPAGHLQVDESILDAIVREVKEETSLDFIPKAIIGIYLYKSVAKITYLRFCFRGEITGDLNNPKPRANDNSVVLANWYDLKFIEHSVAQTRSPLVLQCIQDYLANKAYPLAILAQYNIFNKNLLDLNYD